jgi:hypothetical protein
MTQSQIYITEALSFDIIMLFTKQILALKLIKKGIIKISIIA